MMVIAVVHLVGLAPNVLRSAQKGIMAITVWNRATVRMIFIFVILVEGCVCRHGYTGPNCDEELFSRNIQEMG